MFIIDPLFSACSSYGTTFQLYQNSYIASSNVHFFDDITVKECTDRCVSDALCASVDYRNTPYNRCNIQYVNIKTTTTRLAEDSDFELHVRDCA